MESLLKWFHTHIYILSVELHKAVVRLLRAFLLLVDEHPLRLLHPCAIMVARVHQHCITPIFTGIRKAL